MGPDFGREDLGRVVEVYYEECAGVDECEDEDEGDGGCAELGGVGWVGDGADGHGALRRRYQLRRVLWIGFGFGTKDLR